MRRPTIRLGYVLEMVATAAVCLAVVRSQVTAMAVNSPSLAPGSSAWIRLVGGSFLTGLALAGVGGLIVESVRGRPPSAWGLGRWIWSIAGVFVAFSVASQLASLAVNRAVRKDQLPSLGVAIQGLLERVAIYQFFGGFGWAIAAVCVTAMLAGSPSDTEPDAREWAGRLFASLAVALNIAEPLLRAAGH